MALVIMAFLLKLFMDQSATVPLFIRSLYELPVSVAFLALSFTSAFTIAATQNTAKGMTYLYLFLIISLIVVVMWRRSIVLFERGHTSWAAVLFVLNQTISGFVLYKSICLTTLPVTP